jgi:TonB family protein
MSPLLDITARMSLVLLATLGAVSALTHRSAALRHWILAIGITCGAAIPLLQVALPGWPVGPSGATAALPSPAASVSTEMTVPLSPRPRHAPLGQPAGSGSRRPFPWPGVIIAAWLAGAGLGLSALVAGLRRLSTIASAARPIAAGPLATAAAEIKAAIGLHRPVTLLQSSDQAMPMTWGARRPTIVLPDGAAAWSDERVRVVLGHELAHVARRDWPAQVLAEVLSALYWFNPLVWLACRRLRSESERACDDAVLAAGVDAARYASHLLELARTARATRSALAMARSSSLEGRVTAMLNHRINRRPLRDFTRGATLAAFVALTVPLAVAQARSSTFGGLVVDQTGRHVPDAAVVLTSVATQAKYEGRTDRTGHFQFVDLPSGDYEFAVQQFGFKTRKGTVGVADTPVTRRLELEVGTVREQVNVVAGPAGAAPATPSQGSGETWRLRAEEARRVVTEKCAAAGADDETGGRIVAPTKLLDVKPAYPDSLRAAKIEGVVTLDALIGIDGTVGGMAVVSSPSPELDRLAIAAVQQWLFTPTYLNCSPIPVPIRVAVHFSAQ